MEIAEVLGLEVRLLGYLPLPCTLTLDVPGVGEVLVTSARWVAEEARRTGQAAWTPVTLDAAAYAVQEGRAGASEWAAWCRLLRRPGWRLGPREALAGAIGLEEAFRRAQAPAAQGELPHEPTLTIGVFLRRVGATLTRAEAHDAPPQPGERREARRSLAPAVIDEVAW